MEEFKKGDRVVTTDGSYSQRVDRYEERSFINLDGVERVFEIVLIKDNRFLQTDRGTMVHDVIIRDVDTGAMYLHSLAFLKHAPKPIEDVNERTITIKGKVYTSMIRRGDHSCDGCHLEDNIHAPCGDEPTCEGADCEEDAIWILKEKKDMKQKIEVGMWVRIDSMLGDLFSGHGRIGKVVELPWEHTAKVDVNGEIFRPLRESCIPLKQYTISDTFTLEALLKAESCRDSHFKEYFDMLLKHAGGMFEPIKELPAHFYECDTMRDKLVGFGFVEEVKKKEKEVTYEIGDRLVLNETGNEYIIACPDVGKCCLIRLDTGTRPNDPIKVKNVYAITQEELNSMSAGSKLTLKEDYEKESF